MARAVLSCLSRLWLGKQEGVLGRIYSLCFFSSFFPPFFSLSFPFPFPYLHHRHHGGHTRTDVSRNVLPQLLCDLETERRQTPANGGCSLGWDSFLCIALCFFLLLFLCFSFVFLIVLQMLSIHLLSLPTYLLLAPGYATRIGSRAVVWCHVYESVHQHPLYTCIFFFSISFPRRLLLPASLPYSVSVAVCLCGLGVRMAGRVWEEAREGEEGRESNDTHICFILYIVMPCSYIYISMIPIQFYGAVWL